MVGLPLVLGLAGLESCSCQPTLPNPPDNTQHSDTSSDTSHTGDTGPAPPCDAPEVEPNDSIDVPNPLPMEKQGCGSIGAPNDADYWSFVLQDDAWLKVKVNHSNGSIANMTFTLTPEDLGWAASRPDDGESLDTTLIFPATAGSYSLVVQDQNFQGGDRYGYDVLVSEAKPPVEFAKVEAEPNDIQLDAQRVLAGDRVYGTMSGNGALEDFDWYVITIPPGRHTLTVDVDAFESYSSADLTGYLYDKDLNALPKGCHPDPCGTGGCCSLKGGATGGELDPVGSYDSLGSEDVYVELREVFGREGPADWYVLGIEVTP